MTGRGGQTPELGSEPPWLSDVEAKSNLSRGQFLIWIGQKLQSQQPLYNQSFAFHLKGALDTDRFVAAFSQELSSNDALRTVIDEVDGVPQQRVVQDDDFSLPVIDLAHVENPGRDAERLLAEKSRKLFSLDQRLFDSLLLRLSSQHHIWYLNQHHVVTDAWSCCLLHNRVLEAYTSEKLPPQPSYHQWVRKERTSRLAGIPHVNLEQKSSNQLSDQPTFYGAANEVGVASVRISHDLPKSLVDSLKKHPSVQRCISTDLGLVSAFTSVLSVLIARLANIENICVGLPFHNRDSKEARSTPGLLVEMLPLKVALREDDTFETLFSRIYNSNLDLLRRARPGISTPQANRGQSVVLNYINRKLSRLAGIQRWTEWIGSGAVDSNHKIRLQIHDLDGRDQLQLLFDLNAQVFDQNRRRDVIAQFIRLLKQFLLKPNSSVWSSRLASESELARYELFNSNVEAYPNRSLTSWLSQVARRCADETCLEHRDQQLSYEELAGESDFLANRLRSASVGRGVIVPIFMDKSPEAIRSILAVLKAGGTYLPLDWREPKERLRSILRDVAKSEFNLGPVLVGRQPFPLDEFSILSAVEGITRDGLSSAVFERNDDSIAYVIYTSGSTGTPKGVVISDKALLNYLQSALTSFAPRATNFALHSPLSVDLTVTSIFLPLLSGGKIVIFPDQDSDMPVLDAFRRDAVDAIKLTPSHLALLAELPDKSQGIKTVVVGGEPLKTATLRRVIERFPVDVKIYNEYGPTEATVGCMLHRYEMERDRWTDVPIGKPIANASVFVLNKAGQFTPTGVIGELVISGHCLAEGYLNGAGQTAKKFFQHPILGRCYRSGDLALWRDDDQLKLLGRSDKQLKIRGVRAEPEEIERTLAGFSQIQDVVVRQLKTERPPVVFCRQCGMPSNHPDVHMDHEQVCNLCLAFDEFGRQAQAYFKTEGDLKKLISQIKQGKRKTYDCLALFSGGKDSTYMLYQLVTMGLTPLAVTLDNGYISQGAKENVKRAVRSLKVDHQYLATPHMDDIFADSLGRFSNVCHGCFKTIYTLSTNLAHELGVSHIFTGLSRGQIFETRLHDLFRHRIFNLETIEKQIIEARKVYHRVDDAVSRTLDVGLFQDNELFTKIHFVDFYRYVDVPLSEVYRFLSEQAPWVRPSDTGRSTNCLINDLGIHIHKKERGFHNYALPYSWDVRLGHKTRAEALEELNDEIDVRRVEEIQTKIGYSSRRDMVAKSQELVAYYTSTGEVSAPSIVKYLEQRLPRELVPNRFVRVDEFPLANNGKIDYGQLVALANNEGNEIEKPETELEERVLGIWQTVLGSDQIGVDQDFFSVGGHSLPAIQVLARVNDNFALEMPITFLLEGPTVRSMAIEIERQVMLQIDAMSDEEVTRQLGSHSP